MYCGLCKNGELTAGCHSNEMTPLPILLAAVFLGTGNSSSIIVHGRFFQCGLKFLWLEIGENWTS